MHHSLIYRLCRWLFSADPLKAKDSDFSSRMSCWSVFSLMCFSYLLQMKLVKHEDTC